MPTAARSNCDVHVAGRDTIDVGGVSQQRLQMMDLAIAVAPRDADSRRCRYRVLLQVLADARSIGLDCDAMFGKMRGWPDAARMSITGLCSAPAETTTWRAVTRNSRHYCE